MTFVCRWLILAQTDRYGGVRKGKSRQGVSWERKAYGESCVDKDWYETREGKYGLNRNFGTTDLGN